MRTLSLLSILLVCLFLSACQNTEEQADNTASSQDLFSKAVKQAEVRNFNDAIALAEQAAEEGDLCSCILLAEIYDSSKNGSLNLTREGDTFKRVGWFGQNDSLKVYWSERFKKTLEEKAKGGDAYSMLAMSYGYKPNNFAPDIPWDVFIENDSLSNVWLERAVNEDFGPAWREKAIRTMKNGERDEADLMFEKAIALGDDGAFRWWATVGTDQVSQTDPHRFFKIASASIDSSASGTREWLENTLNALEGQISKGNTHAIEWMAVADSMNIQERIKSLPATPFSEHPALLPVFCEWDDTWYNKAFFDPA